ALMTCAAVRAARYPCSPSSSSEHTTISGLRLGSTPANQPLSLNFDLPAAPSLAFMALLMVCALPVLPAKSIPCYCALGAAPMGLTTSAIALVMVSQFLGSIGILISSSTLEAGITFGGRSLGFVT